MQALAARPLRDLAAELNIPYEDALRIANFIRAKEQPGETSIFYQDDMSVMSNDHGLRSGRGFLYPSEVVERIREIIE